MVTVELESTESAYVYLYTNVLTYSHVCEYGTSATVTESTTATVSSVEDDDEDNDGAKC